LSLVGRPPAFKFRERPPLAYPRGTPRAKIFEFNFFLMWGEMTKLLLSKTGRRVHARPPRGATFRLLSSIQMALRCPKCNEEFEDKTEFFAGKHGTYDCGKCGQIMDWDYSGIVPTDRPGQFRIGGVRPCEHPDKKRPGSREPIATTQTSPR
jgi:hypothetical protein